MLGPLSLAFEPLLFRDPDPDPVSFSATDNSWYTRRGEICPKRRYGERRETALASSSVKLASSSYRARLARLKCDQASSAPASEISHAARMPRDQSSAASEAGSTPSASTSGATETPDVVFFSHSARRRAATRAADAASAAPASGAAGGAGRGTPGLPPVFSAACTYGMSVPK